MLSNVFRTIQKITSTSTISLCLSTVKLWYYFSTSMHSRSLLRANFIYIYINFHQLRLSGPSWSKSRHVHLCVCLSGCLRHRVQFFFEASHWSSDHMTISRPLIGQSSFPNIWWWWWGVNLPPPPKKKKKK